jgi:Uma2 family endonuclease
MEWWEKRLTYGSICKLGIPMSTTIQTTTADDLLQMRDDGFRYELVSGELRTMSPAGNKHGRFAANITSSLGPHVKANGLGAVYAAETGFWISSDPDTVRAPDVAFVSQKRLDEVGDVEGYWPGAPDLLVEVISPGDTYTEVEEKVLEWLEAGARMVVVVNPRKHAVTVYRSLTDIVVLTEKDTLDGGDVVRGWTMAVKDIFA